MKPIIIILFLIFAMSAMAQQRFPSHDHEQAQHRKHGEPRRVQRFTPRIFKDDTSRFYNKLNDCNSYFATDGAPLWVVRQAARDKRTCLREVRKGKR